jgi:hypothetical protein
LNDSSSSDDEPELEELETPRLSTPAQLRLRASHGHPIDVEDACDNDYFFLHAQKTHSNDDCLPTTSKSLEK